jgi:hypothetical protein
MIYPKSAPKIIHSRTFDADILHPLKQPAINTENHITQRIAGQKTIRTATDFETSSPSSIMRVASDSRGLAMRPRRDVRTPPDRIARLMSSRPVPSVNLG